jgi:hypothetical protein
MGNTRSSATTTPPSPQPIVPVGISVIVDTVSTHPVEEGAHVPRITEIVATQDVQQQETPAPRQLPSLPLPFQVDPQASHDEQQIEAAAPVSSGAPPEFQWGGDTPSATRTSVPTAFLATNTMTAAERLEQVGRLEGNYRYVKFLSW